MECEKIVKMSAWYGVSGKRKCGANATYNIGGVNLCRHHARKGRFVARIGDVGEILARFDTEQELRDNIHLYPGARMQHLTRSRRRDIADSSPVNKG